MRQQMFDGDGIVDQWQVVSEHGSSGRRQFEHTIDDQADNHQGRHPFHRAGDPELGVDRVGYLQPTVGHSIRLGQLDVVAAVNTHNAGEACLRRDSVDFVLQRVHVGTVQSGRSTHRLEFTISQSDAEPGKYLASGLASSMQWRVARGCPVSQRIFVTGATGVLGRRVVPALVGAGHEVTAVVRSEAKAAVARAAGATPVQVDLFDRAAIRTAIADHDCVANLATNIPSGSSAASKEAWQMNDRLRRDAATAIAGAVVDAGIGRMIQESITFPLISTAVIDGSMRVADRDYDWVTESTVAAEAAAASVTAAAAPAIVLRFAMFMAPDSAHMQRILGAVRRGVFALLGALDSYISFIHIDDAAAAVVAALEAPAGTYNVAEPDPVRRSTIATSLRRSSAGRSRTTAGDATTSTASSHRISSQHLQDVSAWSPTIHCVDRWKELQ